MQAKHRCLLRHLHKLPPDRSISESVITGCAGTDSASRLLSPGYWASLQRDFHFGRPWFGHLSEACMDSFMQEYSAQLYTYCTHQSQQ